jgi:hypothetical protein
MGRAMGVARQIRARALLAGRGATGQSPDNSGVLQSAQKHGRENHLDNSLPDEPHDRGDPPFVSAMGRVLCSSGAPHCTACEPAGLPRLPQNWQYPGLHKLALHTLAGALHTLAGADARLAVYSNKLQVPACLLLCCASPHQEKMPISALARSVTKRARRGLYAGKKVLSGNNVSEDGGNRCAHGSAPRRAGDGHACLLSSAPG